MKSRIPAIVLPAVLALAGCGAPPDLWPAPSAPTDATVAATAQRSEAGVRLTATARTWPGDAEIADDVTPLWMSVENEGVRPVAVQYANLRLVGSGGGTYRALPLYSITGDADSGPTIRERSPIVTPGFDSREFWLAPHYSAVYPNFPVYQRPFQYDYGYYAQYDSGATGRELPTAAMRRMSLPEGVVETGGRVEGWVFFERVPATSEGMHVRADLQDARSGETVAVLRLPFDLPG